MPVIGLGAKIEVDDGASNAFVEIVDVMNLTTPEPEMGSAESKRLNQAADKTIRMIPTMLSPGEFQFQYEFSAAKKSRLDTLLGAPKNFKITLISDGSPTTWVRTAPGFIKSNKLDQVEPDGIQTVTCVVTVSGPVS
ncbi:hypothetical protein VT84_03340 [Gemmata sp. SH-PL17]|uniref:hypothetical protein n=1 Tax=Gemmata sp. SH-PL17 TaxID=1630693 RepID=UPI00078D8CF9|nr:hypothetical protein [Gemmata sp. SH-PL17]AMV23417.1 hypothetical protein VT84_03340 [Gemmata sp. SH-PL17]